VAQATDDDGMDGDGLLPGGLPRKKKVVILLSANRC